MALLDGGFGYTLNEMDAWHRSAGPGDRVDHFTRPVGIATPLSLQPHRYSAQRLDQRNQVAGPGRRMKSAAARTAGGLRCRDRDQLGNRAENLIVAQRALIERPA